MSIRPFAAVPVVLVLLSIFGLIAGGGAAQERRHHRMVVVPQEDRFQPFAITIRAGDTVDWVNMDTDDHTVVSDDAFDTADHHGVDVLLPGTDSNAGQSGRFSLQFTKPGTFVYYCRFHAHLDHVDQPIAPGPRGGIQDASGNFGTPMMGTITVLPSNDDHRGGAQR